MNVFDYLKEQGTSPLSDAPNAVDSLCLSLFSYLPVTEAMQRHLAHKTPLHTLVGLYLIHREECEALYTRRFAENNTELFRLAAKSERFSNLTVSGIVSRSDSGRQMQFAAMTLVSEKFCFVSFRGTDDTLVGWKEDFNMAFLDETPSQVSAARYLEEAARRYPHLPLYVGGHSKGGNLAIFAAAHLSEEARRRLRAVFAHDAPGFRPAFLSSQGYQTVCCVCRGFVPQTSVVGMLLGSDVPSRVVHSASRGLWQHDPYSWQIEGADFVYEARRDRHSYRIDRTLCLWLSEMDLEQREAFVDTVYELLISTEAQSVGELTQRMTRSVPRILKKQKELDETTRTMLRETVERLFALAWETLREESGLSEVEAEMRQKLSSAYAPVRERLALFWEEKRKTEATDRLTAKKK